MEEILNREEDEFDYHDIKVVNILIFLCSNESENKITERIKFHGGRGVVIIRGHGSAKPSFLELLGLENNYKSILIGVARDNTSGYILKNVRSEFSSGRDRTIGLSIKAAGFAGARLLFKTLMNRSINLEEAQELLKSAGINAEVTEEEIKELFKQREIFEVFRAGIVHEIINLEEITERLKEKRLFEILNSGEIHDRIIEKGLREMEKIKAFKEKLKEEAAKEKENEQEKEERVMPSDNKLIMTIVNKGFADLVMDAARREGATGGTIMGARGTGNLDKSLFGIRIEPEKDIVMIICATDMCKGIVSAINENAGLRTPGSGICFILPVDEVVGLTPIDSQGIIK